MTEAKVQLRLEVDKQRTEGRKIQGKMALWTVRKWFETKALLRVHLDLRQARRWNGRSGWTLALVVAGWGNASD